LTKNSVHRLVAKIGCSLLIILSTLQSSQAEESAVVLMYHRFGESAYPSTNIGLEQFEAHIDELLNGGYTVLPIPDILTAINSNQPLPKKTIGITIDDAYLSVYRKAWPRLRRAKFPFTLFIATDAIDRKFDGYMNWNQIRELRASGVTIGSQTASHLHMSANRPIRNREDIQLSNTRFKNEIGSKPSLFAYPFGEASTDIQNIIKEAGFTHAFGQHSGALNASSDKYYMPRFALNENFGGIKRFKLISNVLGINYIDLTPSNPTLQENPPLFGFTLKKEAEHINDITCYSGAQGKLRMQRLGPRIEVRLDHKFSPGRARINCTAPTSNGNWRWFGMLYYVPKIL
jgi:peptidoglycan/xylan/chitin deacetylase (PgdA/CDA1 family)